MVCIKIPEQTIFIVAKMGFMKSLMTYSRGGPGYRSRSNSPVNRSKSNSPVIKHVERGSYDIYESSGCEFWEQCDIFTEQCNILEEEETTRNTIDAERRKQYDELMFSFKWNSPDISMKLNVYSVPKLRMLALRKGTTIDRDDDKDDLIAKLKVTRLMKNDFPIKPRGPEILFTKTIEELRVIARTKDITGNAKMTYIDLIYAIAPTFQESDDVAQ